MSGAKTRYIEEAVNIYDPHLGFYRYTPRKVKETELTRTNDIKRATREKNVLVAHSGKQYVSRLPGPTDLSKIQIESRKQALSHRNYKEWLGAYTQFLDEEPQRKREMHGDEDEEEGERDRPFTSQSSSSSTSVFVPRIGSGSSSLSTSSSARSLSGKNHSNGITIRRKTTRTGRNGRAKLHKNSSFSKLRGFNNGNEVVLTASSHVSSSSNRSTSRSSVSYRSTRSLRERTMKVAYSKQVENGERPSTSSLSLSHTNQPLLKAYEPDNKLRVNMVGNIAPEYHQDPTPFNRGGQVGDWVWRPGFGYVYNAVPNHLRLKAEKSLGKVS